MGAVFGFKVDVFAAGELELGEKGIVDVGELGVLAVNDEELVGAVNGGDLGDYGVYRAGADGIAIYGARAGVLGGGHCLGPRRRRRFRRFEVNRLEDHSAVIVSDEIDEFAVGREMGIGDHPVEGEGEDFGRAASGRRDGEMVGGVVEEFRVEHGDIGDGFAVGGPSW